MSARRGLYILIFVLATIFFVVCCSNIFAGNKDIEMFEVINNLEANNGKMQGFERNTMVRKCVEICNVVKSAGIDVGGGVCLDNNIGEFSCAIVVAGNGHCPAYYEGVDEVVLNEKCEFLGIYKYRGGEG